MTNPNRPSHREAMRDEAAKTRSLRQCSTSNEHLDKAVSWYLNVGFQDGADWQYEQDKARIEKLEAALKFYADKNNWLRDEKGWRHDMIINDLDDETLTDWDGRFSGKKAREALERP